METKTGGTEAFIRLIGLKWIILKELYDGDRSPKEISDKLGKKLPWISTQLKLLKDNGLVTLRRSGNGRSQLYSLAKDCRKMCDAIVRVQITPEEPEKLPPEPLELILKALKDDELTEDIRSEAASALRRLCLPENKIKVGEEALREFFFEVIDDIETYVDEPKLGVLTSLEYYIIHKLSHSELFWFKTECYPRLLSQFEKDKRVEVRMSSIRILSRIYTRYGEFLMRVNAAGAERNYPRDVEEFSSVTNELYKLFMETLFDPDEDEKIAYKSWEILSSVKGTEQKDLLLQLYEGVKASDERIKKRCAMLLKDFLESYGSADKKGKRYEVGKDASVVL